MKRGHGRPYRVLTLLAAVTALTSTLLPNVTAVVLLVPVTMLVCDRMHLRPAPVLGALVLASNIGGAATLVGDPPNIIIGSRAGLSFNDFLVHVAPIVAVVMLAFLVAARWPSAPPSPTPSTPPTSSTRWTSVPAITDRPLLWRALVILALVLIGFVAPGPLSDEPAVVALAGAGLLVAIARVVPRLPRRGRVGDPGLLRGDLRRHRCPRADGRHRIPRRPGGQLSR